MYRKDSKQKVRTEYYVTISHHPERERERGREGEREKRLGEKERERELQALTRRRMISRQLQ